MRRSCLLLEEYHVVKSAGLSNMLGNAFGDQRLGKEDCDGNHLDVIVAAAR